MVVGERGPDDYELVRKPATRSAPSGLLVEEEAVYRAAGLRQALAVKDEYRRACEAFFDNLELSDPKPTTLEAGADLRASPISSVTPQCLAPRSVSSAVKSSPSKPLIPRD